MLFLSGYGTLVTFPISMRFVKKDAGELLVLHKSQIEGLLQKNLHDEWRHTHFRPSSDVFVDPII